VLSPRVLIIAELSIAQCTKYRVKQKVDLFKALGIHATVLNWIDGISGMHELSFHSLVIFYRVPLHPITRALMDEARRLKVRTLWEVDDLIFDREVLAHSRTIARLDTKLQQILLDGAENYRLAMQRCDGAIASTQALAEQMRSAGMSEVFVVENALDDETICTARAALAIRAEEMLRTEQPGENAHYVRIGYGSGTDTHDVDFEQAAPALADIMRRYHQVRLTLIGTLTLPPCLEIFHDRIERVSLCPYAEYLQALARCDISLAPLEPFVFNDSKSNIKYIEASMLKMPSVCSPRREFRSLITHGVDGFLCETDQEWTTALEQLVIDPALRTRVGEAAHRLVRERYALQNIATDQLAATIQKQSPETTSTRVLSVNIFYHPRSFGGATIVAEEVNRLLATQEGIEVFVFTSLPPEIPGIFRVRRYEAKNTVSFGMGLVNDDRSMGVFDTRATIKAFEDTLLAVRPDLVHIHCIQGIGVGIIDVCKQRGIPYVVTTHDAWWLCARQFMITREGRYCQQDPINHSLCASCGQSQTFHVSRFTRLRDCLKGANRVLTPSHFFRRLYARNGIPDTILQVNKNGIRKPTSTSRVKRARPLTFGYVGGNHVVKGLTLVQNAFRSLACEDLKLVIVDNTLNLGYRSFQDDFFEGIPSFEVVGAYTQDSIDEFFDGIDVLLFPTRWKESFGLTVREAIARNVWVIATDAGGVIEDIQPGINGTIIPFDDDGTALQAAISEVQCHFEAMPLGAEISFSPIDITYFEDQAAELRSIYQDVLQEVKQRSIVEVSA
jgi:glycosyltransferase involved in cell wall biosynthesis